MGAQGTHAELLSVDGGDYAVTFPQSVDGCVYSATLARFGGNPDDTANRITVGAFNGGVRVRTYQNNTLVLNGFHLIVVCS